MPKVYKYAVINENGEKEFVGFKFEVCEYLNCLSIEIDEVMRTKTPIVKGYTIRKELTLERERKIKYRHLKTSKKPIVINLKSKPMTKEEKKLDYLKRHIEEYGNTVLGEMPEAEVEEYRRKLEKIGIKTKSKLYRDENTRKKYYIITEV